MSMTSPGSWEKHPVTNKLQRSNSLIYDSDFSILGNNHVLTVYAVIFLKRLSCISHFKLFWKHMVLKITYAMKITFIIFMSCGICPKKVR